MSRTKDLGGGKNRIWVDETTNQRPWRGFRKPQMRVSRLGDMYEFGDGAPNNDALGELYFTDRGVAQDIRRSFGQYAPAKKGVPVALIHIGRE
jgi:hypothetical protein